MSHLKPNRENVHKVDTLAATAMTFWQFIHYGDKSTIKPIFGLLYPLSKHQIQMQRLAESHCDVTLTASETNLRLTLGYESEDVPV